jgi:hypothetical protein
MKNTQKLGSLEENYCFTIQKFSHKCLQKLMYEKIEISNSNNSISDGGRNFD